MATYYDVIGVAPDATREEIERACDRAQAHLEKSGQIEPYKGQLRKVRETLLNPDLRLDYNRRMALLQADASRKTAPAPSNAQKSVEKALPLKAIRPPLLIGGLVVVALFAVYLLWHFVLGVPTPPDTGRYLLPLNGGEPVAVVIAHDPNHVFDGKSSPAPAVLIFKLGDQRSAWLGDSVVGLVYKIGDPAPKNVVDDALKTVKAQQAEER